MLTRIPDEPAFDMIISNHVLEHLPDPMPILKALRQAIKPGGILFLGVPTLDDLPAHGKKKYCINHRHHFSAYTRRSLSALLAQASFRATEFPASKGLHCMRCVAEPTDRPATIVDPLRDARAFAEYRRLAAAPAKQSAQMTAL